MRNKLKGSGTRLRYSYRPKVLTKRLSNFEKAETIVFPKNKLNLVNIFVKVGLYKEVFQEYFFSTHLGLVKKYIAKKV